MACCRMKRTDPLEAVRRVVGIQAQDLPAALLSVRARGSGFSARDVERAREQDRSLAWTWSLRGTLHLTTAEDARWLVPLLGPELIEKDQRRMRQLGWSEEVTEAGMRLLLQALAERGSMTRAEIKRLLAEHGLPFEGQATIHLIYRAAPGQQAVLRTRSGERG